MPSPEVIDLTLSNDEIQPDPIRSYQGPPTPTQATNRFRTSSAIQEQYLQFWATLDDGQVWYSKISAY